MVPFQAHLSQNDKKPPVPAPENLPKKRKWEEPQNEKTYTKVDGPKPILDIELHLETPLPLDWQRCLDIQSGKIHFYNTMTQKRTSKDPRDNLDEEEDMSLDLELNLTCESFDKNINQTQNSHTPNYLFGSSEMNKHRVGDQERSPSWFACEGYQQEMVAAVCMRCHLLVMLCKSSPECPNCKFMHSPDQTPPTSLFKRRCSLSW